LPALLEFNCDQLKNCKNTQQDFILISQYLTPWQG